MAGEGFGTAGGFEEFAEYGSKADDGCHEAECSAHALLDASGDFGEGHAGEDADEHGGDQQRDEGVDLKFEDQH